MNLAEIIPEADAVIALEPDELGLHILQVVSRWSPHIQLELGNFTNSALGVIGQSTEPYPTNKRGELERAIREAWHWLEGQALLVPDPRYMGAHTLRVLSRRAARLADEPNPAGSFGVRRLPKDTLHPAIREDVWALYHRGKFDTAVFEAMKAVEVAVRDGAGLPAKDIGTALMRKAFDPDSGPLTDMTIDRGEREMRAHLFAGAIGSCNTNRPNW